MEGVVWQSCSLEILEKGKKTSITYIEANLVILKLGWGKADYYKPYLNFKN